MPTKKKKKAKKCLIRRLSTVLSTEPGDEHPLKYLLAQFNNMPADKWYAYPVIPYQKLDTHPSCVFILELLAYKLLHGPKPLPVRLFHGKPVTVLACDSDPLYGQAVRSYFEAAHSRSGSKDKTDTPVQRLRAKVRTLFDPHSGKGRTDAWIELAPGIEPKQLAFWSYDAGALRHLRDHTPTSITIREQDLPTQSVPMDVLDGIAAILAERIRSRSKAAKHSSIRDRIREYLRTQAVLGLQERLHSEDIKDYIPLRMQEGRLPTTGDERNLTRYATAAPLELGRVWRPFEMGTSFLPNTVYFLSSDSGAGKTTFLRHLQIQLLDAPQLIVFYFPARDVVSWKRLEWSYVCSRLLAVLIRVGKRNIVKSCLNEAFRQQKVMLLIDALDDLGKPGKNCSILFEKIIALANGNPLLVAGRPTSVQAIEDKRNVVLLRLEQFTSDESRQYLGESYEQALTLSKGDPYLLTLPMLVYLVRTLIREDNCQSVRSKWDLYNRFLNHIFFTHARDRKSEASVGWAKRMRRAISCVSYHAINCNPPVWDVIPYQIVNSLPADIVVEVDEIPSVGITNLLQAGQKRGGPCLVFSHRSFQEVLAAEWISECCERTRRVAEEHRNSKWWGVLRFMAGQCGQNIVEALYSHTHDSEENTDTWSLVIDCVRETQLDHAFEQRLLRRIRTMPQLCLAILLQMGSDAATDAAWEYIAADTAESTRAAEGVSNSDLLPLFRKDRLNGLLRYLDGHGTLPFLQRLTLMAWAAHITPACASSIITKYLDGSYTADTVDLCSELLGRLDASGIHQLRQDLEIRGHRTQEHIEKVLGRRVNPQDQLTAEHKEALITSTSIEESVDPCPTEIMMELPSHLNDEDGRTVTELWCADPVLRFVLIRYAPSVCRWFPEMAISQMIDDLDDEDLRRRMTVSIALGACAVALRAEDIHKVKMYVQRADVYMETFEAAIDIATTHYEKRDEKDAADALAKAVLCRLGDEDPKVRISVMMGFVRLMQHASLRDYQALDHNLRRAAAFWNPYGLNECKQGSSMSAENVRSSNRVLFVGERMDLEFATAAKAVLRCVIHWGDVERLSDEELMSMRLIRQAMDFIYDVGRHVAREGHPFSGLSFWDSIGPLINRTDEVEPGWYRRWLRRV